MRGFTLIELMIVMFIFSILLGTTYTVLTMGEASFYTGDAKIVVQQEARKAMDRIATELREASSVDLSSEYPFTIWGERIKYIVSNGQLQKVIQGKTPSILANNIRDVQFSLLGGDSIYIILSAQKNTIFGRALTTTLTSQVTLRN